MADPSPFIMYNIYYSFAEKWAGETAKALSKASPKMVHSQTWHLIQVFDIFVLPYQCCLLGSVYYQPEEKLFKSKNHSPDVSILSFT